MLGGTIEGGLAVDFAGRYYRLDEDRNTALASAGAKRRTDHLVVIVIVLGVLVLAMTVTNLMLQLWTIATEPREKGNPG